MLDQTSGNLSEWRTRGFEVILPHVCIHVALGSHIILGVLTGKRRTQGGPRRQLPWSLQFSFLELWGGLQCPCRCALLQMCLSLTGVPFCRFAQSLQRCLITLMPGASAILRFPTRESMSPGEVQLAHSILPSQKVGQPLGPQVAFLRKYSRGEDPAKPGWDSGKQIHRLFFFSC